MAFYIFITIVRLQFRFYIHLYAICRNVTNPPIYISSPLAWSANTALASSRLLTRINVSPDIFSLPKHGAGGNE